MLSLFMFFLKAIGYGIGLSGGFWACGMITRYIEYYGTALVGGKFNDVITERDDSGKTYKQQFNDEWFMKPFKDQDIIFKRIKDAIKAFNNA